MSTSSQQPTSTRSSRVLTRKQSSQPIRPPSSKRVLKRLSQASTTSHPPPKRLLTRPSRQSLPRRVAPTPPAGKRVLKRLPKQTQSSISPLSLFLSVLTLRFLRPSTSYADVACLMCRRRPKNGDYDFCGLDCRNSATAISCPLQIPPNHVTYKKVESKFMSSWNCPQRRRCPQVRQVYKITERAPFRARYEAYRRKYGNESFRYHGTERECKLGDAGHTSPCSSVSCPACSILTTSFKVSFAKSGRAFGPGIYTSSASNKAANYTHNGVMFVTKVVLGKVRGVTRFNEVMSCPTGCNSVIFKRCNNRLNETVVYTNDAIRPVFLIMFG